jgi:triacylglycerol esterase/lipase EstA (alpha/beta hydrolase family)
MAFAIYQTPSEFTRPGRNEDEALAERPLGFSTCFTPTTGGVVESEMPFKLVRPPVVLVHGIWPHLSSGWIFPLVDDPRFKEFLSTVDYKRTNAASFATNLDVPFENQGIRQAITRMRSSNIAATQVDIVGHSMGGILIRNWVSSAKYKQNENFKVGDVHKLVTLNTGALRVSYRSYLTGYNSGPVGPVVPSWP